MILNNPMSKPNKKSKGVKGYVANVWLEDGWKGKDSAIFVYRKVKKSETWFVPVLITPIK